MSPSPQLAAPGSSSYNSETMSVGDGTWDSERNTFLLPNLVGLNFDTMRYNGMGNRFRDMPQYFTLIQAHGILAAITFLFVVPFSIIFLRFYGKSPRFALRLHIWSHILAVLLTTTIIILGFMAVGTRRSLSNPHHGIGVAIYVLFLVEFIGGWWVYNRERKNRKPYAPLKAVIHNWIGRIIGLLGFIQIPLGLTLYGAPSYLFILYSLAAFFLVLLYFILSFQDSKMRGRDYSSDYSWASGTGSVGRRHGRLSNLAKSAAAGVGIGALANRFRNRDEVEGSRRHSGSYIEEEKYSQYGRDRGREGGWRDRILGIGAIAGLSYWAGKLLGQQRHGSEHGSDSLTESSGSGEYIERAEEGHASPQASPAANQPLNPAASAASAAARSHRRSASSLSYESSISGSPSKRRRRPGLKEVVAAGGTFAFARKYFQKRRERKEQSRLEDMRERELEAERIQRKKSRKYTGDGSPRRHRRHGSASVSTDLTPLPGGGAAAGGIAGAATSSALDQRQTEPVASGALQGAPVPAPPPPIREPGNILGSSGSEIYASSGGRNHRRHHGGADIAAAGAAGAAGAAAGMMAGEAMASRRERSESRRRSGGTGSMGSPPVSVKLNMHSDGRHVTLRRLTEEEAAAERARQTRNRSRRRKAGSTSSLSGADAGLGGERWRRTEERERHEQAELERQRYQASQPQLHAETAATPLPPPPPIPSSEPPRTGAGSVGSPGIYDGNVTETSTNYDNNRRRRRAERAAAAREKQVRGSRGDFN